MKILKQKRLRPLWLCAGLGVVLLTLDCRAASDAPTPAELLKEAMEHMQAERFEDAVAVMYMYLGEVDESELPRVIAIAQDIRFKLASILIQTERLDEAAAVLEEYIAHPISEHPRQARKMLATCFFETEDYESCVGAVTNALEYNANPIVEARKVTKSDDDDDEEEYTFDDPEPEADFTADELIMLHLTLAESYFNLEQWAECIAPFEYVIARTPNEQRKGYGIMQIINALIEIPDFDRITAWIPQLYRTSARYDIRVNLALMNAAAALYDAGEYDSALPLYRMILPRDELVVYQESRIRDIRIAHGLPPELGAEMTADEMMLFGVADEREAETEEKNVETGLLEDKPKELIEQENLIIALKELPPYENDIDYRMADLYKTVERHWEGLRFFDRVFAASPESEIGERSIYEIVDTLIEALDEPEEAERRGFKYMADYPRGITPRQIAYMLNGYHQKRESMEAVKAIKPYLDGLERTNDATIVKYDTELYFMQAVADLMLLNYEEAEKGFKYVLDEFPESHQEANSLYWYGMAKLFLQKYADAHPDFESYIKRFPTETYVDECQFQAGVCLFGMEKYDEAQERFSYVINTWPDSSVFPEACSMRGDIYGSKGLLDEAIADYERAIAAAKKPNQATYAVFQMAAVYEAEDRYDEIIRVAEAYLDRWQAEADIAKALFWIGKTRIQQKRFDEAVSTYLDAIVKYGMDVKQDGVDLMIAELVKVSAIFLDTEHQDQLKADLEAALAETDDLTLQLRLRVTLAKLSMTETELGTQLINELPDLEHASPPVLACICEASFENEDYTRAEELLRIFIIQFEESEYMRAAYKLRGFGQYAAQDYEGAMQTIEEAQETYGTDHDVAWAQLMKARVLLDQGKIDEAREANKNLLTVPSWRGEPVAQATYQLGQVEEKAGDPLKAHGYYQRAYFQYKGHAGGHWAAEGYLASARCLKKIGFENDSRNTYRAMLFDPYVNTLPQAEDARQALGTAEVAEITAYIETGGVTNITISVEVPGEESATEEEGA
jgi:TolA-binding protein/thioredoxin-like negative regulator of GroEL